MTPLLILLQDAVLAAVAKGVGKAGQDVALSLLRAALGSEDSLKRMERSVDKLVRQPWRTGIERLRIAISLSPSNPVELSHRASKAREALSELERAWGMADLDEHAPIDLMRGLAAALVPGAEEEAIQHLRSYTLAVEPLRESLLFRAQIFGADASGFRLQAQKFGPGQAYPPGGGLSFDYASDLLRQQRLLRRASEEERLASNLRARADATQQVLDTVSSLVQLLERGRSATA